MKPAPRLVLFNPVTLILSLLAASTFAAEPSLPAGFKTQTIAVAPGVDIFVRSGGSGPAVVLLHGFGDTGDMWGPLASELARDHTVVIPDLRGMGKSSHPPDGYDKKTEATDVRAVMTKLGQDRSAVVGHDIGNMVSYAYVSLYPYKVDKLVLMDAPLPGIDPWDELVRTSKALWHFNFGGPDMERLVKARERIYLDRFWNELSADPSKIDEATRVHYANLYALPGAMHSAFAQFAAFSQDGQDNKEFAKTNLTMPVLAIGGEKSFGPTMAVVARNVATDVQEAVVPNAGHWLMEENPVFTVTLVRDFLAESKTGEKKE